MTKTAVVHAQQMWEYMVLSRKTQDYLVNELNEIGLVGWELVSTTYHKDPKGGEAWLWTAFLKRPRVAPPEAGKAASQAVDPAEKYRQGKVDVGDLTDEFEVHREGDGEGEGHGGPP